jgi:hypothetical protein
VPVGQSPLQNLGDQGCGTACHRIEITPYNMRRTSGRTRRVGFGHLGRVELGADGKSRPVGGWPTGGSGRVKPNGGPVRWRIRLTLARSTRSPTETAETPEEFK